MRTIENNNCETTAFPVRQFYETVVNAHTPEALEDLASEDFYSHTFPLPGSNGFAFAEGFRSLTHSFPDLKMVVEDYCADGERVFTRGYWTGTHKGYFQGIPATGRRLKIPFMDCWKLKDGLLAENWMMMDYLEILLRLEPVGLFERPEVLNNA